MSVPLSRIQDEVTLTEQPTTAGAHLVPALDDGRSSKPLTPAECASPTACIPIMTTTRPETLANLDKVPPNALGHHARHCTLVVLPLALIVGIVTADQYNLDFVHLVQLRSAVALDAFALPSNDALNVNLLRWTFLQSAYWLPMMLFTGAMLVLQFVLLVGRLRAASLPDGLLATLVLEAVIVALMTLLNAFVGESVVGVLFTKMLAGFAVCSALGLVAQAVELIASPSRTEARLDEAQKVTYQASAGFPTITFASIYGLGTAFGCCASLAGYQLSSLLQRHRITFERARGGSAQGYRSLFVVEGAFMLALCAVICILLVLARQLGRQPSTIDAPCRLTAQLPDLVSQRHAEQVKDTTDSQALNPTTSSDAQPSSSPTSFLNANDTDAAALAEDKKEQSCNEKTTFATLRRLSSYCTSPMSTIPILRRNRSSDDHPHTGMLANMRTLQQMHTGFGRWVSSVLRRIMVFVFGGMGVDDAAFDLISAGTSSRETFIAGVLIVSNTSIIQAAVISLVVKTEAPGAHPAQPELKRVPVLPGLPTLAGGVSGAVSAVVWSVLATTRPARRQGWTSRVRGWMRRPWWVPALLTSCLAITIAGLALAVVASIVVTDGTCGSWMLYAATIVTFAGTVPQLPLALLQIYTVLDAELGRNMPRTPIHCSITTASADRVPAASTMLLNSSQPSVHAVRWERVGVVISTLTTIYASTLLTAWVFLLSEGAQMAFLFISLVLAVGGSVWLMLRHTLPLRRQLVGARKPAESGSES